MARNVTTGDNEKEKTATRNTLMKGILIRRSLLRSSLVRSALNNPSSPRRKCAADKIEGALVRFA
jgi:hypothetical protein